MPFGEWDITSDSVVTITKWLLTLWVVDNHSREKQMESMAKSFKKQILGQNEDQKRLWMQAT